MDLDTDEKNPGFGNIQVSEVIFSRDDVRVLTRNIEFSVEWEDEVFILFNEEFDILSYAPTLKEAMLDINDNFRFLYDCYLPEDDNNLTEGAVMLKRKLAELFNCNSGMNAHQ